MKKIATDVKINDKVFNENMPKNIPLLINSKSNTAYINTDSNKYSKKIYVIDLRIS